MAAEPLQRCDHVTTAYCCRSMSPSLEVGGEVAYGFKRLTAAATKVTTQASPASSVVWIKRPKDGETSVTVVS